MKRTLSTVLAMAMIFSMLCVPAYAEASKFTDTKGHWGEGVIDKWSGREILNGYEDGRFNPNGNISRGELAVVLDRVMNYQTQAENNYSDLTNTWYTEAILSATAAGVMNGSGGMARPTDKITRQEATVMIARVLGMENAKAVENTFTDKSEIEAWAVSAVNAMTEKGYVKGHNGAFNPMGFITRAEAVTILDNAIKGLYTVKGTYTEQVSGTVVINTPDVVLKGMKITGDLIIAEGVAAGDVTLDNVTVTGRVLVRGGGVNSFKVMGTSKLGDVVISKADGAVRVVTSGGATVETVFIDDGKDNVIIEGKFGNVEVGAEAPVTFKNADIKTITATAANANITVAEGSKVDTVATASANTTINVNGTVKNIAATAEANGASLNVGKTGTATNIVTAAPNTTVANDGKVDTLSVAKNATSAKIIVGDNSTMTSIVTELKGNITVTTPKAEAAAKALAEATTDEAKAAAEKAVADAKAAADKAAADAAKKTEEKPVTPPTISDDGAVTVPDSKPTPPPSSGGGGWVPSAADQAKSALDAAIQSSVTAANSKMDYAQAGLSGNALTFTVSNKDKVLLEAYGTGIMDVVKPILNLADITSVEFGEQAVINIVDHVNVDAALIQISKDMVEEYGIEKVNGAYTATVEAVLGFSKNIVVTGTNLGTVTYTLKFIPNDAEVAKIRTAMNVRVATDIATIDAKIDYATIAVTPETGVIAISISDGSKPLVEVSGDVLLPMIKSAMDEGVTSVKFGDSAEIVLNGTDESKLAIYAAIKAALPDVHTLNDLITGNKSLTFTGTVNLNGSFEYQSGYTVNFSGTLQP